MKQKVATKGSAKKNVRILETLKRNIFTIGIVMFTVAVGFSGFYAYALSKEKSPEAVVCNTDACISLYKDYAEPNIVTIEAGSFVQFNSVGDSKHNLFLSHSGAQHDDDSEYLSGDFGAGEAWKVQFKKDGAYSFQDKYNEKIYINVVVYTKGKDYKIE